MSGSLTQQKMCLSNHHQKINFIDDNATGCCGPGCRQQLFELSSITGGISSMKLFLSTDFEGTSGIVAWEQIIEGNAEYEQGRRLLTNEVNAVINGAIEGGATQFVVNDSHHAMRNLHPQDLDGQATLITGKHKPLYMMEGLDASFDGVCLVSYHGSI